MSDWRLPAANKTSRWIKWHSELPYSIILQWSLQSIEINVYTGFSLPYLRMRVGFYWTISLAASCGWARDARILRIQG
ncbi:unnamed protein product, partial [Nesidiocoris tenuis]